MTKLLEQRFTAIRKSNPYNGDVIVFNSAVMFQGYNKDTISKSFSKLVNKDQYQKSDRQDLLDHAIKLTDLTEDKKVKK